MRDNDISDLEATKKDLNSAFISFFAWTLAALVLLFAILGG
jgi:hypothetical protein